MYSDSVWAEDVENRISQTGFIIYFLGVLTCWSLKEQKGVTLSSSEVEYVAMSEAVEEIRFIFYLLRDMRITVKSSIMVRTDNVGVMFMIENAKSGVRTRYIDTRYHFIREYEKDQIIKIVFVKKDENDST
jgi:hypothetical protein